MGETIKAIIIDDSAQARKLLRLMLQEIAPEITLLAEAEDVAEGLDAVKLHLPDVLFLDIEMPEKSGLELAEELIAQGIDCEIVFTTAYNEYAIKAFRLSAIDYLLKPIAESQLAETVNRIKERIMQRQAQNRLNALTQNLTTTNAEAVLAVPIHNGYEYISLADIEYLEADGSYVHIFMVDKKQKTASKNLKYFEQLLANCHHFLRVHRSFIINLHNMASFSKAGRGTITMKNGKEIDLARDRRQDFFDLMEQ